MILDIARGGGTSTASEPHRCIALTISTEPEMSVDEAPPVCVHSNGTVTYQGTPINDPAITPNHIHCTILDFRAPTIEYFNMSARVSYPPATVPSASPSATSMATVNMTSPRQITAATAAACWIFPTHRATPWTWYSASALPTRRKSAFDELSVGVEAL